MANIEMSKQPEKKEKQNPVATVLDFVSACMSPMFSALIAGGLIKVLLVILGPTLAGVLATTSDTYILMNALGDAPFYFLPILVAYNASKKLNCNIITGSYDFFCVDISRCDHIARGEKA